MSPCRKNALTSAEVPVSTPAAALYIIEAEPLMPGAGNKF